MYYLKNKLLKVLLTLCILCQIFVIKHFDFTHIMSETQSILMIIARVYWEPVFY